MTWKERRTITILLSILGVLCAVVLILLGMRYRENRPGPDAAGDSAADAVSAVDPNSYSALSYFNGTATLSFTVDDGGKWIWADCPDFPLDSTNLKAILDILSNLHFQQTITSPDSMETYQLSQPAGTLTVSDNRGAEQTLTFGKATTDGDSRYLQRNGDESTVYIIDNALYQHMQIPIYDMMVLPEFPDLTEKNLRSITLEFPEPQTEDEEAEAPPPAIELTPSRSAGSSQPAVWFHGSDNVTSSQSVQELLADLAVLSFRKCIDFLPSSEAASICGFDAPEITLTVGYGEDSSLVLEIGGTPLNESGRCVRLNGESAIYLLPEESLDGLFKVAAREFDRG